MHIAQHIRERRQHLFEKKNETDSFEMNHFLFFAEMHVSAYILQRDLITKLHSILNIEHSQCVTFLSQFYAVKAFQHMHSNHMEFRI